MIVLTSWWLPWCRGRRQLCCTSTRSCAHTKIGSLCSQGLIKRRYNTKTNKSIFIDLGRMIGLLHNMTVIILHTGSWLCKLGFLTGHSLDSDRIVTTLDEIGHFIIGHNNNNLNWLSLTDIIVVSFRWSIFSVHKKRIQLVQRTMNGFYAWHRGLQSGETQNDN